MSKYMTYTIEGHWGIDEDGDEVWIPTKTKRKLIKDAYYNTFQKFPASEPVFKQNSMCGSILFPEDNSLASELRNCLYN